MAQKSSRELARQARDLMDNLTFFEVELNGRIKTAPQTIRTSGKSASAILYDVQAAYRALNAVKDSLLRIDF